MKIVSSFLVSLILAAVMGFAMPMISIGIIMGLLLIMSFVPGLAAFANSGAINTLEFLSIFGEGKPLVGAIILGITVSVVSILLDVLNFYRYQSLRD